MKPRIALHIPVYGRHEIADYVQGELHELLYRCPYDVDVWITYSNESDRQKWENVADWMVYAENRPLGAKFNAAIPEILKGEYLYLMQMGQDDVIFKDYWKATAYRVDELCEMFGPTHLRVMEWKSGLTMDCQFHIVFGAGRMIRMDLIKETWEKTGYIWRRDLNSGLDFNSELHIIKTCDLMRKGVTQARMIRETSPLVMDIKTDDNINGYSALSKFAYA